MTSQHFMPAVWTRAIGIVASLFLVVTSAGLSLAAAPATITVYVAEKIGKVNKWVFGNN
ncbi:MAG: hypothetical protein H5T86_09700, partial [Armatimonadetes bacterium]|nr:hypothetical protein [Armatimonadota bacterium]